MNRKVVVTGSSGFLGRHLVRRILDEGDDVFGIDTVPFEGATVHAGTFDEARVDITDPKSLLDLASQVRGADCLIHLAAIAAPRVAEANPKLAWDVNVQGSHAVLRLAQMADIPRTVLMSSAHVYGISPRVLPSMESSELYPLDQYTVTKLAAENLFRMFGDSFNMGWVALRLFNGFGPGQDQAYMIGATIGKAKKGPFTLRGGPTTKDFVFVSDVVDGIVRASRTSYVGPLNLGTGVETSLKAVADEIAQYYGVTFDEAPPDDIGPTRMRADWSRAKRVLGWEPKVRFADGLRMTLEAADG